MRSFHILLFNKDIETGNELKKELVDLGYNVQNIILVNELSPDWLTNNKIDLIITSADIFNLLIIEMQKLSLDIPVIVYNTESLDKEQNEGVQGFVSRVIKKDKLSDVIASVLSEKSLPQEISIKKTHNLFSDLMDSGNAIIATDCEGIITFMNPAAEKATGYSIIEARGHDHKMVFKILNEETGEIEKSPITITINQNKYTETNRTYLLVSKNNKIIPVEVNCIPIRREDGRISLIILSIKDISKRKSLFKTKVALEELIKKQTRELYEKIEERKQAEQKLQESKEMFRVISSVAKDAILIYDQKGKISFWNNACELMFGYSAEEAFGKNIQMLILPQNTNKDFLFLMDEKNFQNSVISGNPVELIATGKNGMEFPVEVSISPFQLHTKYHVMSIIRDITERKKTELKIKDMNKELEKVVQSRTSELRKEIEKHEITEKILEANREKYRSLTNKIQDVIYTIDINGIVTYISSKIERYGFSQEDIIGKPIVDFVYKKDKTMVQNFYKKTIWDDVDHLIQFRIKDMNGEILWIEENSNIIKNENNEVIEITGVFRNITERKKAESIIKKNLEEKEMLLNEVHHRVKNNMQIISSLLNLQVGKISNKKTRAAFFDSINRIRSMALIHEKLYLSDDFSHVDFSKYLPSLSSNLYQSHKKPGIHIAITMDIKNVFLDINKAIPVSLICNEIMTNAFQHAFPQSFKGKAKIKIKFNIRVDKKYELIIEDNGVGFPENFELSKANSLGLNLITMIAEKQLNAELLIKIRKGTRYSIIF